MSTKRLLTQSHPPPPGADAPSIPSNDKRTLDAILGVGEQLIAPNLVEVCDYGQLVCFSQVHFVTRRCVVKAFVQPNILGVIFFSLLFGYYLNKIADENKRLNVIHDTSPCITCVRRACCPDASNMW